MCGLSGFLSNAAGDAPAMTAAVARMAAALAHRGPDAQDTWVDAAAGIALGHRRLSIIDLSAQGAQPMHSACGRYVVVYNGEIYNHGELRDDLARAGGAPAWRGRSDTEILLAAVAHWGLRAALERCAGMFALALWDRQTRTLTLARDRAGEKPLYYGWCGNHFLFGSELKALRAHPAWRGDIDRGALALFMRYACVPAPYSIYAGIRKLAPGTLLTLPAGAAPGTLPAPVAYWDATTIAEAGQRAPFTGSEDEALAELERVLRTAVAGQMVADVSLGAFLSGGIDSSTVVALMQAHSTRPVKTFTIGFAETAYDEAQHAAAVARHLGTEHTALTLSPQDALDVVPQLPSIYDEPFADPSQVPTHLVAKLARRHVAVSLSGDGGDELFGGYTRHAWTARMWRAMRAYPPALRAAAAALARGLPPAAWDAVFARLAPLLPRTARQSHPGDKIHKAATVLGARDAAGIYLRLISQWPDPAAMVIGGTEPPLAARAPTAWRFGEDSAHSQMLLDLAGYLPDDILVKVDRAAMAVSLETRVPLLDHRVIEFAWRLPLALKIRDGEGKWLLRRLLHRYVPPALIDRPKSGFAMPLERWLRGPLKDWASDLLDPARLAREGWLDPRPVSAAWREHQSGRRNHRDALWCVLMFESWLANQA